MAAVHPELPQEQAYVDHADRCRKEMEAGRLRLAQGGADKFAARKLREFAQNRIGISGEKSLCIGRIDLETGATHYIGGQRIVEPSGALVIINWQAPAAAPFYTASAHEPTGLVRRRRFRIDGTRVTRIDDEDFGPAKAPPAEAVQKPPQRPRKPQVPPWDMPSQVPSMPEPTAADLSGTDALLADLERSRTPTMRDIVATIQADQYRLISHGIEDTLAIQGGPGTGKTAVGLHRAAWLLFNYRDDLAQSGVLVVGPNRAFMEYVSMVLPSLGERAVDQSDVNHLVPGARVRAADEARLQRLKGDRRMADVLKHAVHQRIRPIEEPLGLRVLNTRFEVAPEATDELIRLAREGARSYLAGRTRFQDLIAGHAYDAFASSIRRLDQRWSREEFMDELGVQREWINALDRMWPTASAVEIVRDLFDNERQLRRASEGILSEDELVQLRRRRHENVRKEPWTAGDLPLLDEAEHLLSGRVESYGYVIADEVQDLTPMQFRMVARRARGGRLTVVGDIAQSTGVWRYRDWAELLANLPSGGEAELAELTVGYRVPSQIMELAGRLVPHITEDLAVPRSVRRGPEDPRIVQAATGALPEAVADLVRGRSDEIRTLGVIAPESLLARLRAALEEAGVKAGDPDSDGLGRQVTLLRPEVAKGLEFDNVVVVEPAGIVGSSGDFAPLYVALTRATRTLSIVHAEPLPAELGLPPGEQDPVKDDPEGAERSLKEPTAQAALVETELGPRFTEALMQAKFQHGAQRRRGTGVPYLAHLMAVTAFVVEDGGSEDEAIAALLHDVVEDRGPEQLEVIERQFGERVAGIVAACTDPPLNGSTWREAKQEHLAALESAGSEVRRVALAEKLDNARALLRDYRRIGEGLWGRMEVDPDDLLWYVESVADLFAGERPTQMGTELRRTVDELLELVTS